MLQSCEQTTCPPASRCVNRSQVPSWTAIGIIDVMLELALLVLPMILVWPLQMPRSNKVIVVTAFTVRMVIVPLAVLRIRTLNKNSESKNWPFDIVMAIVFAQLEMHASLIAATIPCLRPFLKAANTGYLATQAVQVDRDIYLEEPHGLSDATGSKGSRQSRQSRHSLGKNSLAMLSPRASLATISRLQGHDELVPLPAHLEALEEHPILDPSSHPTLTTVQHHDQRSMNSDASDRNFIKKTIEYDIQYTRRR
jgi:hypothetical protein